MSFDKLSYEDTANGLRALQHENERLRSEVTEKDAECQRWSDRHQALMTRHDESLAALARVTALCDDPTTFIDPLEVRAAVDTRPAVVTHAPGCRIWRRLYENGEAALRFTCDCGSVATPEPAVCRKQVGQFLCNDREGHGGYCSHIYSRVGTTPEPCASCGEACTPTDQGWIHVATGRLMCHLSAADGSFGGDIEPTYQEWDAANPGSVATPEETQPG